MLSFVICVLVPCALGSYYYAKVASDRFVSGAGFAVRGVNAGGGLDGIGALTGMVSAGSTTSDSYIILRYLESRDLVDQLQADMDLRAAYSYDDIDVLMRLDPDQPIETVVDYWRSMITTSFDATSGIVTFEVQAFRAHDAQIIVQHVLDNTQNLVNRLSQTARRDAVRNAETEVTRAEERLRSALEDVRSFRERENAVNPAATAQLDIELSSALEARLIDLRAQIEGLETRVEADSPVLVGLQREAASLESQIAMRIRNSAGAAGGGNSGSAISGLLAEFEAFEVEKSFAQQTYASALISLEQARIEADRQQRYLAIYASPALPQAAIYPQRAESIGLLFIVAFCLWGIGALMVYSVRDHLS